MQDAAAARGILHIEVIGADSEYTEKGWFCYELCVPEPPEVSEIMDGSCLIRIKPMTEEDVYKRQVH